MWTTNPNLAKLLLNPEDGYKYTQSSSKIVDWKCLDCGYIIKNKSIHEICGNRLSCPRCGDGVSYPEKFITSFLIQNKIIFEKEKIFDWSENKRYDFYLTDFNSIIETHGKQHYSSKRISKHARSLKEEQENDKIKQKLALENNIKHYIVIDCQESELDFIKNNIIKSKLNNLLDLSNIDWLKYHEYACNNLIKNACNLWFKIKSTKTIAKELNVSTATVIKYLKNGAKLGWCDYNPVEEFERNLKEMTGKSIKATSQKVMCIETEKIYNSITEAGKDVINGSDSHISSCCKGKRKSCGRLKDGTKLHWRYIN